MPELPEVETVCRGLALVMDGRRLVRLDLHRPDLRFPLPRGLRQRVEGRRIEVVARRAKYILIRLEDGGTMIGHLGMSGRMMIGRDTNEPPGRHDHVVFVLEDGTAVRFNDPRRFGFLDFAEQGALDAHPMLATLGPEPLSDDFTGPVLASRLAGRKTSIKAALLDQKTVAGIGNIYASEALYWAGISPRRSAEHVTGARAERLAGAIKTVLNRAIAAGGSSLRDFVQTSGELGYFQHQWAVYGRAGEPCPGCDCDKGIEKFVQNARTTFYCARRQR
jgi:formamidopyrimidine-DNA glycosylase